MAGAGGGNGSGQGDGKLSRNPGLKNAKPSKSLSVSWPWRATLLPYLQVSRWAGGGSGRSQVRG